MELAEYNIKFICIKGKHNILADSISRLKMLNMHKRTIRKSKGTGSL